jgi:cell division transport system permease protein
MRRNLLPRMHAPMRAFMVAVAMMVFLAALAAGGVLLTRLAVAEWTAGVVSEMTAQVLPRENETPAETEKRARRAAAILRHQRGVRAVRVLGVKESRALLQPWLGDSDAMTDLPIPVLVAVELDRKRPARVADLRRALAEAKMDDVKVDTHGRWVRELSDLAETALWLGVGVLALLVVALVVLVAHAARAALEANRSTIEVLHLIGANDRFIARQVELHFLRAAFMAAFAGAFAAFAMFVLFSLLAPAAGIGESIRLLLFSGGRQTLLVYVSWLFIVVLATLISLVTARLATMRILAAMFRA